MPASASTKGNPDAFVHVVADSTGLRLRAAGADIAMEYRQPGELPDESLVVPVEALAIVEGRTEDAVTIESSGPESRHDRLDRPGRTSTARPHDSRHAQRTDLARVANDLHGQSAGIMDGLAPRYCQYRSCFESLCTWLFATARQ